MPRRAEQPHLFHHGPFHRLYLRQYHIRKSYSFPVSAACGPGPGLVDICKNIDLADSPFNRCPEIRVRQTGSAVKDQRCGNGFCNFRNPVKIQLRRKQPIPTVLPSRRSWAMWGIMKEEALKEAALWLNRRSFTRIRSRRGISLTGPGQMLWPLPWARPMEPISFRLS